jgi:hypothetical protein
MIYTISFLSLRLTLLGAILAGLFFALPTAAYNITDQQTYLAANTLPVFTFTVPITAANRTLHLPVFGTTEEPTATQFGYEFFSETSVVALTDSLGFILSDAPIVANEYVLAPGQSATFTIVIIGIPEVNAAPQQVRTRITRLPLYLGENRVAAPYTPSELANFVSNKLTVR